MIKNMIKFRKHQEENIERISELFQAEVTFIVCLFLSMCLVILLCRSYIVPNMWGRVVWGK